VPEASVGVVHFALGLRGSTVSGHITLTSMPSYFSSGSRDDGRNARSSRRKRAPRCRRHAEAERHVRGSEAAGREGASARRSAQRLAPQLSARYGFVKEPSVMVWLPPASIASTSNAFGPDGRDATNSGDTVTLSCVAGTVTWNVPTMTW
jgi:hypothetical protein